MLAFWKMYGTILDSEVKLFGGNPMNNNPKYYIVEASALPEVFLKVAEAKRLLATGQAATVNEATQMTDISRSAFYKYRDAVQPFQRAHVGRVITFQFVLQDEPGVLSAMLTTYAKEKANILTINSITPSNGCALVTISAETTDMAVSLEELLHTLAATPGVIKAEVLAG
jgi:chorismate mutase